MTKTQLAQLHISRQKLTTLSNGHFDRNGFDLVLRNIGRVTPDGEGRISSKALTQVGFERVMAFLEDRLSKVDRSVGTYWRDVDRRRGHYLSTRQEWEIHELFGQLAEYGLTYQLASLCLNMTSSRTSNVHDLNPGEAAAMIEMLKAVIARQPRKDMVHGSVAKKTSAS